MTLIRMHQTRAILAVAMALVLVLLGFVVVQTRPTTPVPSQQFQGYSIELPPETKLVFTVTAAKPWTWPASKARAMAHMSARRCRELLCTMRTDARNWR